MLGDKTRLESSIQIITPFYLSFIYFSGPQPERLSNGDYLFIYNIDTGFPYKANPLGTWFCETHALII